MDDLKDLSFIFNDESEQKGKVISKKKRTFDDILKCLDTTPHLGQLKSQLEKVKKSKLVEDEISSVTIQKKQSQLGYDDSRKDKKKWLPQIIYNRHCDQLRFGEINTTNRQNILTLASTFHPVNSFEEQFKSALISSNICNKNHKESKMKDAEMEIRENNQFQYTAKLKSLLFREQMKSKRIRRIKSKMWRKMNTKALNAQYENVLLAMENEHPEVAASIREKLEEKKVRLRMLKRQNARNKWVETALRFGGKQIRPLVNRELQRDIDEREAINRSLNLANEVMNMNSDSDSSHNDALLDNSNIQEYKDELQNIVIKNTIYDDNTNINEKHKQLMSLKFMKQPNDELERKNIHEANELLQDLSQLSKYDDFDNNPENKIFLEKYSNVTTETNQIKPTKRPLPVVPQSLIDKATHNLKINDHMEFNDDDIVNSCVNTNLLNTINNENTSCFVSSKVTTDNICANANEAMANLLQSDIVQNEIQTILNQENIIKEAFNVAHSNANDFSEMVNEMENDDKEKFECKKPQVFGWGSWVDENKIQKIIKNNELKIKNQANIKKPIKKIYINSVAHSKYNTNLKKIQYPFSGQEEYNESMKNPIGPEWNTAESHHRLIQPEIHVRPGCIIRPLKLLKNVPKEHVDVFLDTYARQRNKKRFKSKL